MLLGKNFDDIDATTIQSLIDASASESVHLDFKSETYGKSDDDKRELLKDITAFANTLGGHLVIGIEEKDGAASRLTPLSEIDIDQELQRLENIRLANIEPSIAGLRMKHIPMSSGSVIVINVPRSFNPPHRTTFKNSNRYYARHSSGAYELPLEELRLLFGEQRTIEERAKSFLGDRLLRIQAHDGVIPIPVSKGVLVLQLVPLPDFGTGRRIDVSTMHARRDFFRPIASDGNRSRINVDGYCSYMVGERCYRYTQIFRNGTIEAVTASMFRERDGMRFFPSLALPERLVGALSRYMLGLRALDATPPILVQISALGINGVHIGLGSAHDYDDAPPPFDRDVLQLPPSMISQYDDDGVYEPVIAEQMDFLWNAFDFERCFYFDEGGSWIGDQFR